MNCEFCCDIGVISMVDEMINTFYLNVSDVKLSAVLLLQSGHLSE